VTISKRFAVGKFEVTWKDWKACVDMRGCDDIRKGDRDSGTGLTPVVNMTWDQAQAYTSWLSLMTGRPYRLLTESEWEFAARGVTVAGQPVPYPWGDREICRYANLADQSFRRVGGRGEVANCDDASSNVAEVGSRCANPFRLHDMHGNVFEWVQDGWHNSYAGNPPSDESEWKDGADTSVHVVRGGDFQSPPDRIRSAVRQPAGALAYNLGFRVGRTLEAGTDVITFTPNDTARHCR
jgi:formylglycine-generating enzyme required for sulfatase activity